MSQSLVDAAMVPGSNFLCFGSTFLLGDAFDYERLHNEPAVQAVEDAFKVLFFRSVNHRCCCHKQRFTGQVHMSHAEGSGLAWEMETAVQSFSGRVLPSSRLGSCRHRVGVKALPPSEIFTKSSKGGVRESSGLDRPRSSKLSSGKPIDRVRLGIHTVKPWEHWQQLYLAPRCTNQDITLFYR